MQCEMHSASYRMLKHQLYGYLPPITKTIKFRRTRHAGYCWRSRDELISDLLQWTPSHGRAKSGRQARTNIQQLCEDTGCSPEDLLEVMNDREWGERGSWISVLMALQDDDDDDSRPCVHFHGHFLTTVANFTFFTFIIPGEFFTPGLADGLSVKSEWQQVSSGHLDSSVFPSQFW